MIWYKASLIDPDTGKRIETHRHMLVSFYGIDNNMTRVVELNDKYQQPKIVHTDIATKFMRTYRIDGKVVPASTKQNAIANQRFSRYING